MNLTPTKRSLIPLNKNMLAKMRVRALRRGVWFRVLNRLERASVDLTIKVVETVRSMVLARILTSIMKKLSQALESKVARLMREVGCSLALKTSLIAQRWGNNSAVRWKTNRDFIQYLTVMHMNTSPARNE